MGNNWEPKLSAHQISQWVFRLVTTSRLQKVKPMGYFTNCLIWLGERLSCLLDLPDQFRIIRRPDFIQAQNEFWQSKEPINKTWKKMGNGHLKMLFLLVSGQIKQRLSYCVHSNGQHKDFAYITQSAIKVPILHCHNDKWGWTIHNSAADSFFYIYFWELFT